MNRSGFLVIFFFFPTVKLLQFLDDFINFESYYMHSGVSFVKKNIHTIIEYRVTDKQAWKSNYIIQSLLGVVTYPCSDVR